MDRLHCRAVFVGTKDAGEGRKLYTFRATSDVVDRQGEIVTVDGWDFANYDRNPVILDSHQYDGIEHIVGRAAGPLRSTDQGWEVDVLFSETNPKGVQAKGLCDEGMLNAVSVGFRSLERARGAANEPLKHTRKELLEISVVPVPANAEALRLRGVEAEPETKAADFAQTLTENQRRQDLYEMRWDLEAALFQVLYRTLEDEEMAPEAKLGLVDVSLGQYHTAMLGWFRMAVNAGIKSAGHEAALKAVSAESVAEAKAGQRHSSATKAVLSECMDHAKAVCDKIGALMAPPEDHTPPEDMPPEDMPPEDPKPQGGKSVDPAGGDPASAAVPVLAVDLSALKAFVGQSAEE